MFKKTSAADEIFEAMQQNENETAFAKQASVEMKKVAAMEKISEAAELFEKAGRVEAATKLTRLLQVLAAAQKKK